MFIVATTMALLAAMGVYGLTATAYDVRASGAGRMAAQSQHAAELAVVMTSQILRPSTAQLIVNTMRQNQGVSTMSCLTAKPVQGTDSLANRTAESCYALTPTSMAPYAIASGSWPTASPPYTVPFSVASFGEVPDYPHIRVELTNPVSFPASGPGAGGYQVSSTSSMAAPIFTQVRATVYVQMKPAAGPADSIAMGRGRLTVGPYLP